MEKLINIEAELKKNVTNKKACIDHLYIIR